MGTGGTGEKEEARRRLLAAGWRPEERGAAVVWQNPKTGFWYPEDVAVALIEEGADADDLPREPEGNA